MSVEHMRFSAFFIRQRRTERRNRDSMRYTARLRQRSCGVDLPLGYVGTKKPRNAVMRPKNKFIEMPYYLYRTFTP